MIYEYQQEAKQEFFTSILAKIQILWIFDSQVHVGKSSHIELRKEMIKMGVIICKTFIQNLSYNNRFEQWVKRIWEVFLERAVWDMNS